MTSKIIKTEHEDSGSEGSDSETRSRFRNPKGIINRIKSSSKRSKKSKGKNATVSVSVTVSSETSPEKEEEKEYIGRKKSVKIHHKFGGAGETERESGIKLKIKKFTNKKNDYEDNNNFYSSSDSNHNMERAEVRSPEDDEMLRPWRLEKASNIQTLKTLHKTGKEKKEDSFRQAPRPPLPPADLSQIPKYEFCSLIRMTKISAPKIEKPQPNENPERGEISYKGEITELEIRAAMKIWIWRRTGFKHFDIIRHMKVGAVTDRHRYRYKLESFMERRSVRWIKIPYHGDEDQGAGGDTTVAAPWDIPVRPTNGTLWEEETLMMPVPGTTLLRLCEKCQGKGWIRCWKCDQAGNYLCYWCDGKGGFYDGEGHWKYCWTCKGIGIVYCAICKGYTKLVCSYCEGYFEVKFFIQLKVEYFVKTHKYYIEEFKTDVPIQKEKKWTGCRSGSGERILEEEEDRVPPISTFNVKDVNDCSSAALTRHDSYYTGLRIHRQRHFVDIIPIYEVEASWKESTFVFWIYGQKGQRKIFFPDADAFLPVRKVCCVL